MHLIHVVDIEMNDPSFRLTLYHEYNDTRKQDKI